MIRKKIVPILVIALFIISFAGVAVSAEEQNTITGTIIVIETETGKVSVQDESGTIHILTAGSDIDLGTLSRGDKVIIKESGDGVIKSITKQE